MIPNPYSSWFTSKAGRAHGQLLPNDALQIVMRGEDKEDRAVA